MNDVGLGHVAPYTGIRVFIANRPPLDIYEHRDNLLPMESGEIAEIARLTGNHWRKIFNVYAKIMFALLSSRNSLSSNISTWQIYRDNILLQYKSHTALLFSKPELKFNVTEKGGSPSADTINIIMGKQYAASLDLDKEDNNELTIINSDFAISEKAKLIICPYFDYRQLSNIKIDHLIKLISKLSGESK